MSFAGDVEPGEGDLERAILGESPGLTGAELADLSGATLEQVRRVWRALGFAEYPDDVPVFTARDVEAIATMLAITEADVLDFDLVVTLLRAIGQTMARLADWEVSTIAPLLDHLGQAAVDGTGPGGTGSSGSDAALGRREAALAVMERFGPIFEQLLIYVWRRHLVAAAERVEALRDEAEDTHVAQLTIGFADIVGFTALSNTLTEERIGDLVEVFEIRCADVVAAHRGRVIKSIGDSVLFVNADPVAACDTAEGIISVVGRDKRMPDVRVGLASGSVVLRLGDVFGPPVNMAARLTSVARRNRIIIDAATADLLPTDQFETRRLPARPLRGFGLVEPLAVRRH